jgi:hypothetical protein
LKGSQTPKFNAMPMLWLWPWPWPMLRKQKLVGLSQELSRDAFWVLPTILGIARLGSRVSPSARGKPKRLEIKIGWQIAREFRLT